MLVSIVFVILMCFCMILTCANKMLNFEPGDLGGFKNGIYPGLNYCPYLCLCMHGKKANDV